MHNVFTALQKLWKENWFVGQRGIAAADEALNAGTCLLSVGLWRAALPHFDRVLSLAPRDAAAYYYRGIAHEALGHYEQAMKDYSAAILLDPHRTSGRRGKKETIVGVLCR